MTLQGSTGEIQEIRKCTGELRLDWQVSFVPSRLGSAYYESPYFTFCDGCWCLRVWPNCMMTSGWVWICLILIDGCPPETLHIAFGTRGSDGVEKRRVVERKFPNDDGWCWESFCFRPEKTNSDLKQKQRNILSVALVEPIEPKLRRCNRPTGLTITCEMMTLSKARGISTYRDASIQMHSEVLNNSSQILNKQDASSQTEDDLKDGKSFNEESKSSGKRGKGAVNNEDANENNNDKDVGNSKNKKNAKQPSQIKNTKKISLPEKHGNVIRSLKEILAEGSRADFTLKSGDRQWPVHRAILEGRSGHLATLFGGEWAQTDVGEVPLDDVTDSEMDSALHFIYAGEVPGMSVKNVCGIYTVARMFLLEDLKHLCVEYMREEMCPEMASDALVIAETYGGGDLKESALECFFQTSDRTVATEGWKRLKTNHPAIIAELFEETIKRERKKRRKE